MSLILTTLFYLMPIIICWIFIYNFTKDEGNKNEQVDKILFTIFLIISVIPILNLIFAFIISIIFVTKKPKKKWID